MNRELDLFRNRVFFAYKLLIVFSVILGCLLPDDLSMYFYWVNVPVNFLKKIIPYILWIDVNSRIPKLSTVWFSVVWGGIFTFFIYIIFVFPYKFADDIFKKSGVSIYKYFQAVFILSLFSVMTFFLFFERRFALLKSTSMGHARFIEVFIIDYRFGLIFAGPWLITLCVSVWGGLLILSLIGVSKIFLFFNSLLGGFK